MNPPRSHKHIEIDLLTERIISRAIELDDAQIPYTRQIRLPALYKGRRLGEYRIDLLVDDCVIVEVKAVERAYPLFEAQLLTYVRATDKPIGLLLNFNARLLKDGIKRMKL